MAHRIPDIFFSVMLCLFAMTHTPAAAQTKPALDPKSAALLDDYAMINGGWMLNQHCNLLSKERRREFEWSLANVNQTIGQTFDTDTLAPYQNGAEHAVNDPKYAECGDASKGIISSTTDAAIYMSKSLTKRTYDPETSYSAYISDRFVGIAAGMQIEQKCGHIPDDIKPLVAAAYQAARRDLGRILSPEQVTDINTRGKTLAANPTYGACGNATLSAVHAASMELRVLQYSLEQDRMLSK